MDRQCKCGQQLRLELRTILAGNVQILHVPMRTCEGCSTYDLLPPVKTILTEYMKDLVKEKRKRIISFTEVNEISEVIFEVLSQDESDCSIEIEKAIKDATNQRINLLLDLFKHAESLQDGSWIENLRHRLGQLSSLLVEFNREKEHSYK